MDVKTTKIRSMDEFNYENKTVILRIDINSPIDPETKKIMSDNRIKKSIPTIKYLLFFNRIFAWMKRYKSFSWINNIIEKKISKNSSKMDKYKEIALIIFIGVPLPTTGLWTGSAIAAFLQLDFKKSLLCAIIGGIISGGIITVACIAFPWLLGI
jgi:uncharacterized membrane protein